MKDNRLRIYDNGGETLDRYTVIYPDGSADGMSRLPMSPLGFCQYVGDNVEPGLHLGSEVREHDLPQDVRLCIRQRMQQGGMTM